MIAPQDNLSQSSIGQWLSAWLAGEFGLDRQSLDLAKPFLAYGMNSVQAMMLVGDLEVHLGLRLRPTLVWDYPNAAGLAAYLTEKTQTRAAEAPVAKSEGEQFRGDLPGPAEAALLVDQVDGLSEAEIDALLSRYIPDAS